jgi:tetratricopeptide (TPR) repeat protein
LFKLKQISSLPPLKHIKLPLLALILIIAGCSLEKESGFNRNLQNLTAHYNILFNAKESLRLKQESYASSFIDNYNEILNVYQDTTAKSKTPDKDMEGAIVRANKIINIKEQSHYLGDAYLVLGKANYLEANYYDAVEYFTYVIRSFPKRVDLTQDALVWKARALMYLNQVPEAKLVIDSAIQNINPKKKAPADIFATKLLYDINAQEYADGEEMAKQAILLCRNKTQRLRWTFILAQLQELNHKPAEAFKNYTRIAKSNATFEMAFNASLNRIRIEDTQNGVKKSRTDRLLGLLKDPNNKDFKDQIYYQVATIKMADKDVDNAIKYYKLSIRASTKNQNQKGLSYLRIAEINFKIKADYLTSKKYYDSTLTTLPANYPGYKSIQKIGANLQLLADRFQIIIREDTLQALAKMDEKTRSALIDRMVNDKILQQQQDANAAAANAAASKAASSGSSIGGGGSTFYFYNSSAVGQGIIDFKRRWGNRKLEDDWRRSTRSSSNITNNTSSGLLGADPTSGPVDQTKNGKNTLTADKYRRELLQGLPLTADQLVQSNVRIYNAYVDIGNFYRDILDDKPDAIATFELILRRFPNDPNKAATYYSLYRLYSDADHTKADMYKNKILKEYPETPFARIITDPDYAKKLNDKDAEFTQAYNAIFDLYVHKQYKEVIASVPALLKQYPDNKFSAQLYYLEAIAAAHDEKVQPFQDTLKQILNKYPNDRLIAPLITQHLSYINANLTEMLGRPVVLVDDDPHEIPFTLTPAYKETTEYRKKVRPGEYTVVPQVRLPDKKQMPPPVQQPKAPQPVVTPPAAKATPPVITPPPVKAAVITTDPIGAAQPVTPAASVTTPVVTTPAVQSALPTNPAVIPPTRQQAVATQPAPILPVQHDTPARQAALTVTAVTRPDSLARQSGQPAISASMVSSIFSMSDSTNYYFVVNVNSSTTNVSSSRFGIGQFNRVNYTGKGIKHQLITVGDNQLIYVGRFLTLAGVKKYAREIVPLLPEIMKVKDKYSFFIITQENLNKLADKNTLDSYIDYYQKNYLQ